MDISDKLTNLKNQLLDLAIRGKLVEQRPEEGAAEELYTQIQEEKKKLIAEGKIKKEKSLPEITEDEIPFEIPESWKWLRLGNLISIKSGEGLVSSKMKEGNIPVYGGNGVTGYHNEALVNEETVVIGRVGFYCGSVHITEKRAWVTDNAFITSYPKKFIDIQFLVYWLRHLKLGENNNSTAQPVVSGKKIYPLLFPLPPLAEQKRIVAKLESYLAVIDKAEELIERKANLDEEIRNKILDLAIRGKLVEQRPEEGTAEELYAQILEEKKKLIADGKIKKEKTLPEISEDEIPFDIPESWKWVRLSEVITNDKGGGTPSKQNPNYWNGDIPWMSVKDFSKADNGVILDTQDHITQIGLENSTSNLIDTDAIIICTRMGLGKIAKLRKPTAINQDLRAIWLTKFINEAFFINYYSSLKLEGKGTTVSGIQREKLLNKLIPLPPIAEQKRIVAKIEELLPYCDKLK